jgi:hypothetical protein
VYGSAPSRVEQLIAIAGVEEIVDCGDVIVFQYLPNLRLGFGLVGADGDQLEIAAAVHAVDW